MLFILEIWLTVKAWKTGWKALALIPIGLALGFGFVAGVCIGGSGGSVEGVWVVGVLIDFVVVGILSLMCSKAPQGVGDSIKPASVAASEQTDLQNNPSGAIASSVLPESPRQI